MDKEALNDFVKFMTETLKSAKDFTVAQAPEIAKEVLHYGIASSLLLLLLGISLLCVAYVIHLKIKRDRWDEVAYLFVLISSILGTILIGCSLDELFKISFAPRIFLIEYFAHLVRAH